MKITTQKELDDLIATADKSNTIVLKENLEITFDCVIRCNINTDDDIKAYNIKARIIDADNINAEKISYHAFCIAYQSFKCKSIEARRENSIHKCLDQEIEFIEDKKVTIELTQEQLDKIKHLIKKIMIPFKINNYDN